MILKAGGDSIQKVESEFTKIIDSDVGRDEKFDQLFSLTAEGHAKIDTTSQYVENLSEKERQDRMLEISGSKVENGH